MSTIPSATLKSTGFATILFWLLFIIDERQNMEISLYISITIVPIFIICFLAIILTIMPFYWLEANKLNSNQIFNKYFPYYSIIVFGICSFYIIASNFEIIMACFFTTAFFTSVFAWIWIFKPQKK